MLPLVNSQLHNSQLPIKSQLPSSNSQPRGSSSFGFWGVAALWNCPQTLLLFGGLHPLCGIGVTSRIDFTSRPIVCSARIADSRPAPGPLTRTSSVRMPNALAALPAAIAAWVAANGVPLREPLKPMPPALDQAITFPSVSVIVIIVLLNDAWMC